MKINLALAAVFTLAASLAQAQSKTGRETGYRYRNSKPAAPAPAAPKKAVAPAPKAKGVVPQTFRRRDDEPAAPSGPAPQAGALIRTAGVGTKTESHNPGWTYYGDMGAPQGWGYAINGGGQALGGAGGGVRQGRPDNPSGRSSGMGSASTPFGTGGGQYQSWLSGINNTTINGNAHNNNNGNGGGNGNGNGR